MAITLIAAMGFSAVRLFDDWAIRRSAQASVKAKMLPASASTGLIWQELLQNQDDIIIAFSNATFSGTASTGMKYSEPISDRSMVDAKGEGSVQAQARSSNAPVVDDYTGIGEAVAIYHLSQFLGTRHHGFHVKPSQLLTWDDLRYHNVIVLGGPDENRILRELPQQKVSFADGNSFRNLDRGPGEPPLWKGEAVPNSSDMLYDYAMISVRPSLDSSHRLILLYGTTTFGTEAAAEFVSRAEYLESLQNHLIQNEGAEGWPRYFEAIVRVDLKNKIPTSISYVKGHVLSSD